MYATDIASFLLMQQWEKSKSISMTNKMLNSTLFFSLYAVQIQGSNRTVWISCFSLMASHFYMLKLNPVETDFQG